MYNRYFIFRFASPLGKCASLCILKPVGNYKSVLFQILEAH